MFNLVRCNVGFWQLKRKQPIIPWYRFILGHCHYGVFPLGFNVWHFEGGQADCGGRCHSRKAANSVPSFYEPFLRTRNYEQQIEETDRFGCDCHLRKKINTQSVKSLGNKHFQIKLTASFLITSLFLKLPHYPLSSTHPPPPPTIPSLFLLSLLVCLSLCLCFCLSLSLSLCLFVTVCVCFSVSVSVSLPPPPPLSASLLSLSLLQSESTFSDPCYFSLLFSRAMQQILKLLSNNFQNQMTK